MGSKSGYNKSPMHGIIYISLENTDLPEELIAFRNKWFEQAKSYTDYKPCCPVKGAGIVFRYKDVWYSIYPESIGITTETNGGMESWWVDEMFEHFAGSMENELVSLGAEDVFYTGMMD